jgi:hypothetical protein
MSQEREYRVYYHVVHTGYITVTAESNREAELKAEKKLQTMDFPGLTSTTVERVEA